MFDTKNIHSNDLYAPVSFGGGSGGGGGGYSSGSSTYGPTNGNLSSYPGKCSLTHPASYCYIGDFIPTAPPNPNDPIANPPAPGNRLADNINGK